MGSQVALIEQANNNFINPIAQEIGSLMPPYLSVDQFRAAFIVGVQNNPEILTYEPTSVRNALIKCATDGLLPDGRLAAVVPFKDKKQNGQKVATYMPMIAGIIRRAAELGELWGLTVENVHEKDEWYFDRASGLPPKHVPPMLGQDRGAFCGCYAIFKDKNMNIIHIEVMDNKDVAKIRAVSKRRDGPWEDWFGEMARKSVARRGSKWVPTISPQMRLILEREDELVDFKQIGSQRSTSLPAQINGEAFSFDDLKPGLYLDFAKALTMAETPLSFNKAVKDFWEEHTDVLTEEQNSVIEAIGEVNKERIRKDIPLKEFYARLKTIIGINDTPAKTDATSVDGEGEAGPDSSNHDTRSNERRAAESIPPAEPATVESASKEAAPTPSPEPSQPWVKGTPPINAEQYDAYALDHIEASTDYESLAAWLGCDEQKNLRRDLKVTQEAFKELKAAAVKKGKNLNALRIAK